MSREKNRPACMSDLKAYFRKLDLLGGLTEIEKGQLRKNIGVVGYDEQGGQLIQKRTYQSLLTDVKEKLIIVGSRYLITDFQTIYSSNHIVDGVEESWGDLINPSPTYQLLVTGINEDQLDSRAYIIGKDWEVEYDIRQDILHDGVKTKGKITWLKDSNGNSAHYDFKSVKFRRTREELKGTTINSNYTHIDLYTFSNIVEGVAQDSSNTELIEYNELKTNCWNNVFLGDTYNNIFESECQGNTFIRGCHDTHLLWKSAGNIFNEPVAYATGTIQGKIISVGNTVLSSAITKTIHKVVEATIVSFLDPVTYAYQVIIIK